ncbi:glutamyl-tRNA(Gln) amidotransferase subunit C [Spiroplasma gladiatoris]|uniref:Glutamyl-tRNA(Gln) amidotransferase subunit C n=1 Tax=Spiroplasma gladiatoris TaxID=2143 RepID=A0A4P7AGS1_9MOLU|nr:Asp-tRNA(Asn)/Glu-tRNA(Gln) amidotransferase subunit GatC [Spiroplasma gladiatoris]QBQ07337.1 glutamyl-tRNA(Gln) amidotransferase subunit C [Spiroplasma gladiatoris]
MKIEKKLIYELADDIMLDLTEQEADEFLKLENDLLSKFEKVFAINVNGVEPSHYCFEYLNSYLRDDNQTRVIQKNELLNNAPKVVDGFVAIEKVVK